MTILRNDVFTNKVKGKSPCKILHVSFEIKRQLRSPYLESNGYKIENKENNIVYYSNAIELNLSETTKEEGGKMISSQAAVCELSNYARRGAII